MMSDGDVVAATLANQLENCREANRLQLAPGFVLCSCELKGVALIYLCRKFPDRA